MYVKVVALTLFILLNILPISSFAAQNSLLVMSTAIYDIIGNTDDSYLEKLCDEHNIKQGSTKRITQDKLKEILEQTTINHESSGGSAANTAAIFANLGGNVTFLGPVGDDKYGHKFAQSLKSHNTKIALPYSKSYNTGIVACLVNNEVDRTMFAYTGSDFNFNKVSIDKLKNYDMIFTDGYTLFNPCFTELLSNITEKLSSHKVALSLSSEQVVNQFKSYLLDKLLKITVIFANKNELMTLFDTTSTEDAIKKFQNLGNIGVFTLGKEGSVIVTKNKVIKIPVFPAKKIVDTTGAGDSYAAGFLYGYLNGFSLKKSGELGSKIAAQIVSFQGALPQHNLKKMIPSDKN